MAQTQEVTIEAELNARMGWYSSQYAADYLLAKFSYESRRKKWTIKPEAGNIFLLTDSSGATARTLFTFYIKNCSCVEYNTSETGFCQHIVTLETNRGLLRANLAVNLDKFIFVDYPNVSLCKIDKKIESIDHVESLDQLRAEFPGFSWSPAVEGYLLRKARRKTQKFITNLGDFSLFQDNGVTLYDHQKDSIQRMLYEKRTILTLKMGLGKTICGLYSCAVLKNAKKIIIICPNSLKFQWQAEINRFDLGSSLVISKGSDLENYKDQRFLIISYEMLNRHILLLINNYDVAIIDEIQKIKNEASKTWETIQLLQSEFVFALSGTPIQNSISDIISILKIISPHEFNPDWRFYEKFCELSRTRISGWKQNALPELKKKFSQYIINPKIDPSNFKLPTKTVHTIECTMDQFQLSMHNPALEQARKLLSKSAHYSLTFQEKAILNGLLLKARRAASDARLFTDPQTGQALPGTHKSDRFAKIEELIVEKVKAKEKVVVYSEWIDCLDLLKPRLDQEGIGYTIFTGEQSDKGKNRNLNKFMTDPACMVFLSTDSGGLGVDGLQRAAKNVIHIEAIWNPAKMSQRDGRLVRALQKADNVDVYHFNSNSGIEEMLRLNKEGKNKIIAEMQ